MTLRCPSPAIESALHWAQSQLAGVGKRDLPRQAIPEDRARRTSDLKMPHVATRMVRHCGISIRPMAGQSRPPGLTAAHDRSTPVAEKAAGPSLPWACGLAPS